MWEWLADAMQATASVAMQPNAYRTYAIAGMLLTTLYTAYEAIISQRWISNLRPSDFVKRFPGVKPSSDGGIEKREKDLRTYRDERAVEVRDSLAALIAYGLIIPSLLLVNLTLWYPWLDESTAALVTADEFASSVERPSLSEVVVFTLSQATSGAVADAMEVFGFEFARLTNNPRNFAFSFAVLIYRLAVGLVATALVFLGVLWLRINWMIRTELRSLRFNAR